MVNRRKNIAQWYIQSKTIMYIHFDPMSSYPGLPFYITVDNCNYQLIIRGIKTPHEFIFILQWRILKVSPFLADILYLGMLT